MHGKLKILTPALDSNQGDELAEIRAQVQALAARVEQLEAVRPRDPQDTALRWQLADSTHGLEFRSRDLLEHGAVDADLRRALVRLIALTPAASARG